MMDPNTMLILLQTLETARRASRALGYAEGRAIAINSGSDAQSPQQNKPTEIIARLESDVWNDVYRLLGA
jgi:hypothetical protein